MVQAADFVGDSKAYSQAVRELAETLFPSLHACLDGMSVGPDEISGPVTSVRLALVRAFRAEHGMNPSAKVRAELPQAGKSNCLIVPFSKFMISSMIMCRCC